MLLRGIQGNKDGDEPLYFQPLPPSPPTRVGSLRVYDSALMPDGRQIIFSAGRSVYQALRDGSPVRRLFDVPGRAYWFRWSPGDRTHRFTVYDSQRTAYSIWQTPTVGHGRRLRINQKRRTGRRPRTFAMGTHTARTRICGSRCPPFPADCFHQSHRRVSHIDPRRKIQRRNRVPDPSIGSHGNGYRAQA